MYKVPVLFLVTTTALILSGCTEPVVDEPIDSTSAAQTDLGPRTLGDAVTEIIELRNRIRSGFASGDPDAAHGPLHEVGDVLTEITKLAEESDLSETDRLTVQSSAENLLDAFGEVDKTFHGQEGSTYDEEAETIDSAILNLASAAGVTHDSLEPVNPAAADDTPVEPEASDEVIDAEPVAAPAPE